MKTCIKRAGILITIVFTSFSFADYAVIVNPSNAAPLSEDDVAKLFLAKSKSFPDGKLAIPINHKESSAVRADFDKKVLSKSPQQMKAYWSKLIFTGKAVPIKEGDSDTDVVELVTNNATAIGYVDAASVTDGVKVLFKF